MAQHQKGIAHTDANQNNSQQAKASQAGGKQQQQQQQHQKHEQHEAHAAAKQAPPMHGKQQGGGNAHKSQHR